jgi:hypothetical protein
MTRVAALNNANLTKRGKACCISRTSVIKQNIELKKRVKALEQKAEAWDYISSKLRLINVDAWEGDALLHLPTRIYVPFSGDYDLLAIVSGAILSDIRFGRYEKEQQQKGEPNENNV